MRLLDQMAGVVIYSRQHLLEPPYQVQPGDTLERIAEALNVPALLLARINGVRDSESLRPGRELKVLRGPFSAVIDLGKSELTLMLRDRYAGRFPVTFISPGRLEGSYTVICKQGTSASDGRGGVTNCRLRGQFPRPRSTGSTWATASASAATEKRPPAVSARSAWATATSTTCTASCRSVPA